LPYPGDKYYVGIAFKPSFRVQKIVLNAPAGYSFGVPGEECYLHEHDLSPFLDACKVGSKSTDGSWVDKRAATIELKSILPMPGDRYHFMIAVTNPGCPHNIFVQVVSVKEQVGIKEVCSIDYDQNLWEMQLTKEVVDKGITPMQSLWAAGYKLHNPEVTHKASSPGSKDEWWGTTNAAPYVSLEEHTWRQRANYCSARLEPCPGGADCPASGVCPTGEEDVNLMEAKLWGLTDTERNDDTVTPKRGEIDDEEVLDSKE
jgi:hypothetical protein